MLAHNVQHTPSILGKYSATWNQAIKASFSTFFDTTQPAMVRTKASMKHLCTMTPRMQLGKPRLLQTGKTHFICIYTHKITLSNLDEFLDRLHLPELRKLCRRVGIKKNGISWERCFALELMIDLAEARNNIHTIKRALRSYPLHQLQQYHNPKTQTV